MILHVSETERLIRGIEGSGSLDAIIAAFALVEAGGESALAQAWSEEVEPIRGRLPGWVVNDLSDLLLERLKECARTNCRTMTLPSGTK